MRIAFPVTEDRGMESPVYGHFGSAPLFMVLDSANGGLESIGNSDAHHAHGQCQPIQALGGTSVDLVVVGGIGGGALVKLPGFGNKGVQGRGRQCDGKPGIVEVRQTARIRGEYDLCRTPGAAWVAITEEEK